MATRYCCEILTTKCISHPVQTHSFAVIGGFPRGWGERVISSSFGLFSTLWCNVRSYPSWRDMPESTLRRLYNRMEYRAVASTKEAMRHWVKSEISQHVRQGI